MKIVIKFLIFFFITTPLIASWDILEEGTFEVLDIEFFNEDTGFSGLLRTTNGGATWNNDWIIPPYGNPKRVQMLSTREGWLIFQETGLERPKHNLANTTDCGNTWLHVYNCETDFPYITQIKEFQFIDINHGWIQGNHGDTAYFAKTDDGGENWHYIFSDIIGLSIVLYFVDSLNGYLLWNYTSSDCIIVAETVDGGANWDSISSLNIPPGSNIQNIYCKEFNEIWLCAGDYGIVSGCRSIGPRMLFHSIDSGYTFDTLLYDPEAGSFLGISFKDSLGIISDWNTNLFFSSDNGETWENRVFEHYNIIPSFSFRTVNEIWAAGWYHYYKSTDYSITWEVVNPVANVRLSNVSCNSFSEVGVAATFSGLAMGKFSLTEGESWIYRYPDLEDSWIEEVYDIEIFNPTSWFVLVEYSGCRGVFKTTNSGISWDLIFYEPRRTIMHLSNIEVTDQYIWLSSDSPGGELYKSSDGGSIWDTTTGFSLCSRFFSYKSNYLWLQQSNTDLFWHTIDGGENWYRQAVGGDTLISSFQIKDAFFLDSLMGWCFSNAGSIYVTTNGGDDWSVISTISISALSYSGSIDFVSITHGFIAGNGLYETTDGGLHWIEIPGFSEYTFYDMDFADSMLGYAVGENGVITKYTPGEWIFETNRNNLPSEFVLTCYPNPFNLITNIQFKLLKKELIEISVYNVLGVKVKELVNRELEKGNYSFKWNAIDQPSGIYFCLFSFNNNSQYKRLLLLK